MSSSAPSKRWVPRKFDERTATRLASELGVSKMLASLLASRGVTDPEAASKFLKPKITDLHDPFLMRDMRQAVDRINRAIAQHEKILIYGDYDVDGTTSTVILKKALSMLGAQVSYFIPERIRDGYGMRDDAMDRAKAEGHHLVISVDTGIRANQVVEHARSLGLDVIITDHHLPEATLPQAAAVLNPKRSDCGYPFKGLAGVGVAFKLAQALLIDAGRAQYTESFLKVAALGTIADIMPLVGENRVIAKYGLLGLSHPVNVGLKALLEVAGIAEGPVSAVDVAFKIAPRINAMGRMAGAKPVVELFDATDLDAARRLASEMDERNISRQKTGGDIIARVLEQIETDPAHHDARIAVVAGEGWHRGVIGIAASRIVEQINRPAIVISVENGIGHGSGRSIPCFHLLDGLSACSDLFDKFGGHAHAAGIVMRADRIDELRSRLNQYAKERLSDEDLTPSMEIDCPLPLRSVDARALEEIRLLEPYGNGNPEPVFEARGVEVIGPPQIIKEKHLKLRVAEGRRSVSCMWWGGAPFANDISRGDRLNLAFTLSENDFGPYLQVDLNLRDVRVLPKDEMLPP
ncbi:MAG TPA: single-stranded-DNA-specific exonuclease RecJ [Blastocatellia bacterium]|nr:single-stranded-DNA-specific exonuclease RecJ [Blastocatellia bacterium]